MFFDNYQTLCIKKGVSPSAAAKEIGVNPSSMTGWSKGALPRMATARRIADYFGVTTDDLMNSDNIEERYEVAQMLQELNKRNVEQKSSDLMQFRSVFEGGKTSYDSFLEAQQKHVRKDMTEDEQALLDLLRKAPAIKRLKAYAAAIKALTEDDD